jgi:hypothetical protein
LQSRQELFDPFTPDSYQPRLHHTASLVEELENIAGWSETDGRWETHVAFIKAELRHVAGAEKVFLDGLPRYNWSISQLLKLSKPRDIVSLARTLRSDRDEYGQRAIDTLRLAAAGLPKSKKATRIALGRIATNFIQSGRAAEEALASVTEANLIKAPAEIAEILLSSLARSPANFQCILALNGDQSAVQHIARKIGFTLVSSETLQTIPRAGELKAFAPGAVFVIKTVAAEFAGAAAKTAARELRQAIELFNFYQHRPALELGSAALIVNPMTSESWAISPDQPALRRLKPRKNAVELTHGTLDSIDSNRLTGYLRNALEHCSLAHSGTAQKIQFVNLWSAMECLAASKQAGRVLDRVSETVVPIVVWRRVEKLLRYLAIALHTFQSKGASVEIGGAFPQGTKFVSPGWLMLALTKPANHPHLVDLFKFAAPHPLLCNRVKMLWDSLSNPGALAAELALSKQRIEWHLARIYRARNLIVHHGMEAPHMTILLDHLHFYFSITLSRILHGLRMNVTWRPEDSVTHWVTKSAYVLDGLKEFPKRLRVADFFAERQSPDDEYPWQ